MKTVERPGRVAETPPLRPPDGGGWIRRMMAPLLRAQVRNVCLTMFFALGSMGATAATPLALKEIVDRIQRGSSTGNWLLVLLGLGVVRFATGGARRYFSGRVSFDVEYDLRNAIYDHVQRLDFATHDRLGTGQLVSRANSDVRMLQGLLAFFPFISANIALMLTSLVLMLVLSPQLSLVSLLVVPGLVAVSLRARSRIFPASWDAQQKTAEVAGVVDEAVTGVRVVKAFAAERHEIGKFSRAAYEMFRSRMRMVRLGAKFTPLLMVLPALGTVALLYVGGRQALAGTITLGTFLAFNSYLVQLAAPARMLAGLTIMAQMTRAGAERILELLDSTPEVQDPEHPVPLPPPTGSVSFKNVTFGYLRSEPVLKNFSLDIRTGETVALVGTSGSGKSTVAMLLPRFYDPHTGRILVDGTDVRTVDLDDLRRRIGVVFEDAFLFSTTIRENLAYGRPDATQEQIEAAARGAGAHGFISELPDGYETMVGEHGLTLSGGQRQRVALARAILTDPSILILDDATSSVDAKVEAEIHATLRDIMRGRSTIIVAHRRSTLSLADRIVVMDRGEVVAQGSHAELMESSELYRMLLSGPGDDAEGGPEDVPEGITEDAWRGGGSPGAMVRQASGAMEPPHPMSHVGNRPGGMGGGHMASFFGGMPASPELLEKIAALGEPKDEPDVDEEQALTAAPSFTLRKFIRPYRGALIAGILLVGIDTLFTVLGPAIVGRAVDHGIIPGEPRVLYVAVVAYLAITLADWFVIKAQTIWMGRFAERMLYALRLKVFGHLQRLSLDFYDKEMAGRIMSRMTSDIESLSQLLQQGLATLVLSALTLVGVAGFLYWMNWRLAMVMLIVIIPLTLFTLWFRRASDRVYLKVRDKIAAVLASFQESLSGVRVSQAFTREERNMADFRRVSSEHVDARVESIKISALYFPSVELLSVAAMVMVLAYGSHLIGQATLTAGALIAFILYINQFFAPIQQLSQVFDQYQQARAATIKLTELLSTPPSTPEKPDAIELGSVRGEFRLEGVKFRYADHMPWALNGVDLTIAPGEAVALVGETGAGKSTIMKLAARFYDPVEGSVRIDGHDLRDVTLLSYRTKLGIVPQEPFLFAGTIRDNIAYGRMDASDAEVEAAARTVGAHDFIASLPEGYLTPILERGKSLSSGERQLIALARARLVDPAVLLLDEATSNLDLATEAKVQRAMGVLQQGRTTILIAHRLPTARRADRIVVIDHGRVVEDGTHDDLIARGGFYAELWSAYGETTTGDAPFGAAPSERTGIPATG